MGKRTVLLSRKCPLITFEIELDSRRREEEREIVPGGWTILSKVSNLSSIDHAIHNFPRKLTLETLFLAIRIATRCQKIV